MKIHVFGSCSGTEPMPGRRHVAFAAEAGGKLYWFDAGEGSSYTAHLMGLDLLKVRSVFISHTHMDHVGGLGNLFWNIRKLTHVKSRQPEHDIKLFIPNSSTWDGIYMMLKNTEGNFHCDFKINVHPVSDGVLYEDENIKVEALHNMHLGKSEPWLSYSYRFSAEGKRVIYSGDIRDSSDLDEFLKDGCDVLMTETGHHTPDAMPRHIAEKGFKVGKLMYIHCGPSILADEEKAESLIQFVWPGDFVICRDGVTYEA